MWGIVAPASDYRASATSTEAGEIPRGEMHMGPRFEENPWLLVPTGVFVIEFWRPAGTSVPPIELEG